MNSFNLNFILVIIFQLILYSGCTDKIQKNIENYKIVRYNESKNVTSLDPAFARNPQNIWPSQQIFNSLVQMDDSLNIKPEIASKWNISKDGLTYTFFLRNDVFFHESDLFGKEKTRKVIASDFEYSFKRLRSEKIGSPGGWVLNNVNYFKALSDSIFMIQLNNKFPAFLSLLSMRYCSVVPHEVVDFYGEKFRENPIGTGPFKLKRWIENEKLVLVKNKNYFEFDKKGNRLPYLDAIAVTFFTDPQSEFMLFDKNKIDFITSLDNSYKDELLTINGDLKNKYINKIILQKGPMLNTEYLGFYLNSDSDEISSKKIREAINIGFNRNQMISYLKNGIGIPAYQGFLPVGIINDYIDNIELYNPEKAKILVDQYIEETNSEPKIFLSTDPNYVDICEFIQNELKKIGINIIINVIPSSALKEARSNGKVDFFRSSWIADYPDAENFLSLFHTKNFAPFGPNYTHFSNKKFDSLYNQSLLEIDKQKREEIYLKMNKILTDNLPVIPIYYDQAICFLKNDVKNLKLSPINTIDFKYVDKK